MLVVLGCCVPCLLAGGSGPCCSLCPPYQGRGSPVASYFEHHYGWHPNSLRVDVRQGGKVYEKLQ